MTDGSPAGEGGEDAIRVLHVDDDPDFVETAAAFLEREGDRFAVETATSADEGLDRLADGGVDCVVADYDMPGRDGLDLLEAIREEHPDLPFVLYTGKGSEEVASEAISAGVTDYLQKGVGTDQYAVLANRIANAVERYRAERARRLQREAIETAQEGIALLSADGEFIHVNEAYAKLYGYDPEELVGERWERLYPDDEVSFARETVLPTVAEEGRWHGETTGLRADGTTFPEDHVVARTDAGALVCTVRDRSEREAWRTELTRFRTLVETLGDPVYVLDEEGQFEYVNGAFRDRFGYGRDEVVGATPALIKSEEAVERAERHLGRILSDDGPERVRFELEVRPKEGDPIPCEDHMGALPYEGEFNGSVGILRDVTERTEYEERLREERAFMERCLDALGDVFYVFDAEGEPLRWNDRLSEVTGYADDEIASMGPTDFFPDDHVGRVAEAVEEVFETGRATVQADYLTADGERVPHEFTGFRLTDPDGSVAGFAGIGRDLRERREYERQLERRNERLEEFASIVSHDLRNPLNVADGRLELAREERDDPHLEAVAEAHARIGELVDELLTLAREGTIALDPEPTSVGELARMSWRTVETDGATLDVERDVTVRADESRLRQLLENLFRNAVEHGGDVTVRVGALDGDDGFYVADDGPGIPEDERAAVFESGVTTSEDGIGAGLSIVRRVAEAHGWDVTVTGSESGGARFEIAGTDT